MKTFILITLLAASITAFPHDTSPFFNPFLTYNSIRLPEDPQGRIVGGEATDILKFPHIVSLQWNGNHRCGANILSERFLITAAHCTSGLTTTLLSVRVGSSFFASGGTIVRISRIIDHPSYDSRTIDYDYSILELAEKLQFSDSVQPIPIPEQGEEVPEGFLLQTLGWGNTLNANEPRDRLRVVVVPKVTLENCIRMYAAINALVTPRMICAGFEEGGRDACQG
jgi:trypsin